MTTSKIALDVLSDFKLEVAPKQTKSRVERVLTERYKLNDLEEIKKTETYLLASRTTGRSLQFLCL